MDKFQAIINKNRKKTMLVLLIYCAIFILIGFLIDIVRINANSIGEGMELLLTLSLFPMATFIMFGLAACMILFTFSNYSKIMLSGNEYVLIEQNHRLYKMLLELVESSGLRFIPSLYIIEASYMNAFASGWKENNAMIVLSSTLVQNLEEDEVRAVMAHELSHIIHGDIRLTMIVGVLGNVMLLAINFLVHIFMRGNSNAGARAAKAILFILQLILPFITTILQLSISRNREYMADSGAAYLMGDAMPMVRALQKISASHKLSKAQADNPTRRFAYIIDTSELFSTHPTIENRIDSLLGNQSNRG